MNDEKWLHDLARVEIEEREGEAVRLDERWDRLSRGELSPEEEAELRALSVSSEEAAEAYELFRPFSPEVQARMLAKLAEQERAPRPATFTTPSGPSSADPRSALTAPDPPPAPPDHRILPFPKRQARYPVWQSAAGLAAAAALVLIVRSIIPPTPFPQFEVKVTGFALTARGPLQAAQGRPTFRLDGDLTWILKSKGKGVPEVAADCFVVREKVAVPCAKGALRIRPKTGTVVVHGVVGEDLHLTPGESELCVLVGFRDRLPEAREQARLCSAGSGQVPPAKGYQIFHQPLRVDA